jgi:2,4-dienoyl-CoA reductase-like NADH-dependent reductase (Old Yellow Enzyme family)
MLNSERCFCMKGVFRLDIDKKQQILALFSAFDNPSLSVKNRFVRSATYMGGADDASGELSEAEIGRCAEVAAGGAGTIISGMAYVSPEGKSAERQWGLHCDARTADVRRLADSVHKFGSRLVVQLCHAGGQKYFDDRARTLTPSGLRHPGSHLETEAMKAEDFEKVREDFTAAALRAQEGGADAVELHGGHGYLFTQFLSPALNKRTDEYGGSLENRARLFREVLSGVKKAVGPKFPVWFKFSAEEGTPDGYGSEEGLALAKLLLADGADGAEVSSGAPYASGGRISSIVGVSAGESEAPFRAYARELKKSAGTGQLVILTGGLRSLEVMSDLLRNGYCDLFGLSRPFNCEPDLVNRWAEDDSRPSACVSCNACFSTLRSGLLDCPVMRERNEGEWDPMPEF